jgi:hypothetical protein
MDYQDQLLEKQDGRYYAIDKVGTGLGSIATEELLKENVVSFGLPSGPALFLHLAYRAYVKIKDVVYSFPQKPIANRTASPITEQPTRSEPVFSHLFSPLSNCSRNTGYCLAVMHDRFPFPTHKSKCGL